MKRYILLIIVFIVGIAFAQDKPFAKKKKKFSKKKEEVIENVTYEQTQDIDFVKNLKKTTKFKSYLTKGNTLISVGDTLFIGKPNTLNLADRKESSDGLFTSIEYGDYGAGTSIMKRALTGSPPKLAPKHSGDEIIIESIECPSWGASTCVITIVAKDYKRATEFDNKRNSYRFYYLRAIPDLERSIRIGEIKTSRNQLTRAEAIAKLKEAKDLLDLEIMTREEYDKLKEELTPIIRNN
jgi:hypothetical protein